MCLFITLSTKWILVSSIVFIKTDVIFLFPGKIHKISLINSPKFCKKSMTYPGTTRLNYNPDILLIPPSAPPSSTSTFTNKQVVYSVCKCYSVWGDFT